MTLRGDHDDGAGVDVVGGEVGRVDEVGAPAQGDGQVAQRVRHRRPSDDDEVRRCQHRFDVDLHRALALAGDGDERHAVGNRAEMPGQAEQQQARLAIA